MLAIFRKWQNTQLSDLGNTPLIFNKARLKTMPLIFFIRLRQNTPWLATGMNGEANLGEVRQMTDEDGLAQASAEFRLACATDAPRPRLQRYA